MPIKPIPGPLYPGPQPDSSLVESWRRFAGRLADEANNAGAGIPGARGEGARLGSGAGGARANLNQIRGGVRSGEPGNERSLAQQASGNRAGADARIRDAERNAFDPRAPAPNPNTGAPEGQIGGAANNISNRGHWVSAQDPELPKPPPTPHHP